MISSKVNVWVLILKEVLFVYVKGCMENTDKLLSVYYFSLARNVYGGFVMKNKPTTNGSSKLHN